METNENKKTNMSQEINYTKIRDILRAIEAADVMATSSSPYLHSCEVDCDYNSKDFAPDSMDIILSFSWTDEEGYIFRVDFTAESLSDAVIYENSPNKLNLFDSDGEREIISIYNLIPGQFHGLEMSKTSK